MEETRGRPDRHLGPGGAGARPAAAGGADPPHQQYAISVITAAALLHGVHLGDGARAQQRSAFVEKLLAAFSALPVDLLVARAHGRLSAALAVAGTSVNSNDLGIGATAIAHGLEVLALDGDFDRIPGLRRASVD